MTFFSKLIRAPWLMFLVLGAVLYALVPNETEKPLIHISRAQLDAYLQGYLKQFPIPYSAELEQRLLQQLIAEEALLQQALSMDYQYLPVVQDRLKKLGSFVQEDGAEMTDQQQVEKAIELGLLESDPVVRRYLVSVMERALVASSAIEIEEGEIDDYYQQNLEDYIQPGRVDITHVFFSEDQGRTEQFATEARQNLLNRDVEEDLGEVLAEGDVFYSGHQFTGKNEAQLASIFGTEFAQEVFDEGMRQWSMPIHSAYGWHLVWLDNSVPAQTLALDKVQDKVIARLRQEKEKELLKDRVEQLKQHFDIVVEASEPLGDAP